jgi:hypothetical protein
MRWTARALVAVVVLLIAFLAWPLFGLKKIADAIAARDATAFTELLDVPELKRSLAVQIVLAYLRVTGKDQRLSPLARNLAVQAGVAIADAYVVEIVKAEALIDLLRQTRTETIAEPKAILRIWGLPNLRNVAKLLSSEYSGRNFYVTVPLSADAKDGFRLRLRLSQWEWRLAGIDLPEKIQFQLAQEFIKRSAR